MKLKLILGLLLIGASVKAQEAEYMYTYDFGEIWNDSLKTHSRMKYPNGDSVWNLFMDKKNGIFYLENAKTKVFSKFILNGQDLTNEGFIRYTATTGKDTKCIIDIDKRTNREYDMFQLTFWPIRQQYKKKLN